MMTTKHFFMGYLWVIVCVSCSPEVGPSSAWVPIAQIGPPLQPETGLGVSKVDPEKSIRIVTYNVHHGENVDEIAAAFKENAELKLGSVLLVQEIQAFPNEAGSRTSRLAQALGMNFVYAPARTFESGTHGNAILSRYPLENISVMELPKGEIVVDMERRIALRADVRVGSEILRVLNVHLDTRLNATERILQLRPAIQDLPEPLIVAGDFNTNPLIWAFNLIPVLSWSPAGTTDQAVVLDDYMATVGFRTPTSGWGETVAFPVLKARIDSIYVRGATPGAGAIERGVSASDHWPLWLDVTLP